MGRPWSPASKAGQETGHLWGDHVIREGGKVLEPSPRWNLQAVATAGRGAGAIREGSGLPRMLPSRAIIPLRELKDSGEVYLEGKMINSIWMTALKGK